MDVHTPKPVHSLRELAREIGIIVIGVLIALGGEQLVVAVNRAYEARATEEALRQEVGNGLINAAERVMVGPCLSARLAELSQAVNQGAVWRANPWSPANTPVPFWFGRLPRVYRAPIRPWNNNSWQAVTSSGGAAHLSEEQLRHYGLYYREIEQLRETQAREGELIAAIQPLAYDQALSADKRVEMQATLAALDRTNDVMTLGAAALIEGARRNGFAPDRAKLEDRFRGASSVYGNCVQRLGSTASALPSNVR
jgi:hypothetical protein